MQLYETGGVVMKQGPVIWRSLVSNIFRNIKVLESLRMTQGRYEQVTWPGLLPMLHIWVAWSDRQMQYEYGEAPLRSSVTKLSGGRLRARCTRTHNRCGGESRNTKNRWRGNPSLIANVRYYAPSMEWLFKELSFTHISFGCSYLPLLFLHLSLILLHSCAMHNEGLVPHYSLITLWRS